MSAGHKHEERRSLFHRLPACQTVEPPRFGAPHAVRIHSCSYSTNILAPTDYQPLDADGRGVPTGTKRIYPTLPGEAASLDVKSLNDRSRHLPGTFTNDVVISSSRLISSV